MKNIRQPIVTIAGHVDSGKTTILDSIRGTHVAKKEAGGITQKISFTGYPASLLQEKCSELLKKFKIEVKIPGFLFIDTPGHAAFTNLRKRGGSLADLAILVIDINEGMMPQTYESIEILRQSKIPFVVALNKIDAISGWRKIESELQKNIEMQSDYVKKDFDNKLYRIIAELSTLGLNVDLFFRVNDFTKQLALIPCSGKTGEGIKELLVMLTGLAQRFLIKKLALEKEGKGTTLEIKKERDMFYIEAILYDGTLKVNDEIFIASLDKPIKSKIRAIFEALPLGKGFKPVQEVSAASGIRLQLSKTAEVLSGMPFSTKESESLQKEVSEALRTDEEGVIIKADSLGSLEALLFLLRKENIPIGKVGMGNINKADVISAASNSPLNQVILGFNVVSEAENPEVSIITNNVIYKIIEDFKKWLDDKKLELEKESISSLTRPCKIKILQFVFHASKPAIFGVHVEEGMLKSGIEIMNSQGRKIDKIKAIQSENKTVEKAERGKDVAISLPNVTYGRQVRKNDLLYSDINEQEFLKLKENKKYLNQSEISVLQEIAEIKRKEKPTWGI
ncbi:translation initiation factor IF-2 [Candidatus Pacearchaeota archaeon]|nr:translation initiation factor IF-2 [Candidatus Pacearchaeota archaeon]